MNPLFIVSLVCIIGSVTVSIFQQNWIAAAWASVACIWMGVAWNYRRILKEFEKRLRKLNNPH